MRPKTDVFHSVNGSFSQTMLPDRVRTRIRISTIFWSFPVGSECPQPKFETIAKTRSESPDRIFSARSVKPTDLPGRAVSTISGLNE